MAARTRRAAPRPTPSPSPAARTIYTSPPREWENALKKFASNTGYRNLDLIHMHAWHRQRARSAAGEQVAVGQAATSPSARPYQRLGLCAPAMVDTAVERRNSPAFSPPASSKPLFRRAAIGEIGGDPCRAERVIANWRSDASRRRAPLDHAPWRRCYPTHLGKPAPPGAPYPRHRLSRCRPDREQTQDI